MNFTLKYEAAWVTDFLKNFMTKPFQSLHNTVGMKGERIQNDNT